MFLRLIPVILTLLTIVTLNAQVSFLPHEVLDSLTIQAFTVEDIDKDLDMDIIVKVNSDYHSNDSLENKLVWFQNNGNNNFQPIVIPFNFSSNYFMELEVVDIDLDNDFDIIVSNPLGYMLNDGNNNFTFISISSTQYFAMSAVDFDFDGDLDVLAGRPGHVGLFLNDGSLNFTYNLVHNTVNFSGLRIATEPVDLDMDGDMDVLTSHETSSITFGQNTKMWWYENVGNGVFNQSQIFSINTAGNERPYIYTADIDSDNDVDIVSRYTSGATAFEKLAVYKNNGNQIFSATSLSGNLSNLYCIGIADLDLDNDIDVIANVSGFKWFENDLNQNYQYESVSAYPSFPYYVTTKDFDGDGDVDLITSSTSSNSSFNGLGWSENLFLNDYSKISVIPFVDINQNSVFEVSIENSINTLGAVLQPNANYLVSNSDSIQFLTTHFGLNNIELLIDTNIFFPIDSLHRVIDIDTVIANSEYVVNIGLYPKNALLVNSDITSSWPRCQEIINHKITLQNLGLEIDSGYITYTLDSAVNFVSSTPAPAVINGQSLTYAYNHLHPSFTEEIEVLVQMPTTIQALNYNLLVYADTGQMVLADSIYFEQEVQCSYDPNDKTVFPDFGNAGYILNDNQELEFLVRFQNTGNDTAFFVEIVDTLSTNLDLTSFRLVAQSDPVDIQIDFQSRISTFTFNDIILTDTTTNESESHGFIKYAIMQNSNLLIGDTIENTANIFFDNNPPITTNTTLNTIYDCDSLGRSVSISGDSFCLNDSIFISFNEPYLNSASLFLNNTFSATNLNGFDFTLPNNGDDTITVVLENDLCSFDSTWIVFSSGSITNITVASCDSFVAPNGDVWISSGVYSDTLINSIGCDSVISIDLFISNSSTNSIVEESCFSYVSPSGNEYVSSGIYMDTFLNIAGCDSIITVDLTIHNSSSYSYTDSSETTYTSPSGNYVWNQSGTYMDTIANENGCDSILTINLTILEDTTGISNISSNFKIYPNPTNGSLSIIVKDRSSISYSLQVKDVTGKTLISKTNFQNQTTIQLGQFSSGIYVITIEDQDGNQGFYKILKE